MVVLGVVWVVLGVVLEQVEAVAKPLLLPVLKKPPPGPPKPPPGPPKTPPGPPIVFFICFFLICSLGYKILKQTILVVVLVVLGLVWVVLGVVF